MGETCAWINRLMARVVFNSRVFEKNTQQTVFTYVFTIDTWPYFAKQNKKFMRFEPMSCSTVYGGLATTMKFDLYMISILLTLNKPIVFIAPQIVPCVY